ncbi:hypothetical protein NMY22_g6703 [Coprinellus aureogranulatus]|nr:hypothetical protein NMY22_g6703 [Coprinellus aureogranulatus]
MSPTANPAQAQARAWSSSPFSHPPSDLASSSSSSSSPQRRFSIALSISSVATEKAAVRRTFFDGDTGKGLGASHQTGWSGLVAYHILQSGVTCRLPKTPKTPRSILRHYFDETLETKSEYAPSEIASKSAFSAVSSFHDDHNTLYDISPDAL